MTHFSDMSEAIDAAELEDKAMSIGTTYYLKASWRLAPYLLHYLPVHENEQALSLHQEQCAIGRHFVGISDVFDNVATYKVVEVA